MGDVWQCRGCSKEVGFTQALCQECVDAKVVMTPIERVKQSPMFSFKKTHVSRKPLDVIRAPGSRKLRVVQGGQK